MSGIKRTLLATALAATCGAAPPPHAQFTCASCHAAEARTQPSTAMGIGLELPPDQAVLKAHPKLTFEANGYTYLIERQGGESVYTVSGPGGTLSLPIRYAFGVKMQTFVLEHEGRFYESLVSFYPPLDGLAITMGSERIHPRNPVEAMGRETSPGEILACFNCHTTGGVANGKLQFDVMRPGLACEHCHEGAAAHQAAMAEGKSGPLPPSLAKLGAEDMSNFCGQCHRTWDSVVRMRLWGPLNVRFQPYRLANSKCFLGDDRRIACAACHNPHRDLMRDETSYDKNCLACHGAAPAASSSWKSCPVGKSDCVSCHMPKVELPGGHARFTDHTIRVVRAGDPYPN